MGANFAGIKRRDELAEVGVVYQLCNARPGRPHSNNCTFALLLCFIALQRI